MSHSKYRAAGVDIDAAVRATDLIKDAVRSTYSPQVLADVGSFGGLYALTELPQNPVLVASTDGVGSKVELALRCGHVRSLGHDIVNHCFNDILVQNARPLFFLDYVASSKLRPENFAEVVVGIAEACRNLNCVLLGGEMAEMPGMYKKGVIELVGTIVGLVEREEILPRKEAMAAGDVLIGLPSSGPHTNGYSLIRKLTAGVDLDAPLTSNGPTWAAALLAPHCAYGSTMEALREADIQVKGIAHITGGGLYDNLPRVLPLHLKAEVELDYEQVPPLFQRLWQMSGMDEAEAFRVWNMGVGMVLIVAPELWPLLKSTVPDAWQIGQLVQEEAMKPKITLELTNADFLNA